MDEQTYPLSHSQEEVGEVILMNRTHPSGLHADRLELFALLLRFVRSLKDHHPR